MLKSELRKIYLEKRKAFSKEEVLLFSEQIKNHFFERFLLQKGDCVHIFLSIDKFKEVDTTAIIKELWAREIRVFVPKMIGDNLITLEILPNAVFETNSWGIREPLGNEDSSSVNLKYCITPLLYCDPNGQRVGYGKGFYDRLFASLSSKPIKIGVGFFSPEEEVSDASDWDVPMDYLITPTDVVSFTAALPFL